MVLTDLGWRIRRIWSTEWWMDALSAAEKIHTRLTADLEADRASRPPAAPPDEDIDTDASLAREKAAASVENAPDEAEVIPSDPIEPKPQHPQQLPPDPANDREPVEEPKIYARGPTPAAADPAAMPGTYTKADPSTVAAPDRERRLHRHQNDRPDH
jgi:hypothetical protein